MKKIILIFLALLSCLLTPNIIYADNPALSNPLTEINIREEFTLHVYVGGLTRATNYRLRIAIAKEGSENYFGEVSLGSSWYGGGNPMNYSSFYGILTDNNGFWAGDVKGRVNYGIYNYDNSLGKFNLKLALYTDSSGNALWSQNYPVEIKDPNPHPPTVIPSPTPTIPLPTDTPTPVPAPADTPVIITPTAALVISVATSVRENKNPRITGLVASSAVKTGETESDRKNPFNQQFFFVEGWIFLLAVFLIIYYRISKKGRKPKLH